MTVIVNVFLAVAGLGILFNLAAALLLRHPGRPVGSDAWPSVTILKPLHGAEPALADNLASFFAHDYAGAVQIIFGARGHADAGLSLARDVAAAHAGADTAFVANAARYGANNKLSNLTNMMVEARHEIVIVADSDVAWETDTLRRLVCALSAPGVGLVSCLLRGRGDAGFWSQIAAMDIAYRYMPSVIAGTAMGLARPVLGPTHALHRKTLDAIGGFAAFTDVLADDYEIGRAVRRMELATRVTDFFVTHGCSDATPTDLIAHELRWSITIFRIDPAGFRGSIVVHALPVALIAASFAGFSPFSIAIVAAAFAARAIVKLRMDAITNHRAGALILLPARDLLSFVLFCATFFIDNVNWRGTKFRVTRDGKLHSQ